MSNNIVMGGKKSQRNGKIFEMDVERSCIRYRSLGIADIKKTPEPMRSIGVLNKRLGWHKAIFEKKGQPDFLGTLKGGRSVMIEAKNTNSTRIEFDRIEPHQAKDLQSTTDLGGLALVLIKFNSDKVDKSGRKTRYYCIEWSDWIEFKDTIGKKSLNEKDLVDHQVKVENGLINFLRGELEGKNGRINRTETR